MLADAQRHDLLAAMGIDVYLLRTRDVAPASATDRAAAPSPPAVVQAGAGDVAVVVACAPGADAHAERLRKALPTALGIAASRMRWIQPDAGGTLVLPAAAAAAYLALGADMARTLGAQLSTMQQRSAVIAVADAPQACLRNGLARRALWQALKPIARHLRQSGG